MHIKQKLELVVGAGDWESLSSALDAGANAIYCGIKEFNLRINAKNFELNEIPKVCARCHDHGVKLFITLNAIFYESEREKLCTIINRLKEYAVDGIICWDFAVITEALTQGISVHLSTQASVSNVAAVKHYYDLGVKRIVLARECSIDMIKKITEEFKKKKIDIILEVFAHGAMCISVSGRCFISEYLFGRSANRGDCLQPCRRKYHITDVEDVEAGLKPAPTLEIEDGYILSPKDLCTIDIIDQLIDAGVRAFKIEGRTRPCEYIKATTQVYRRAINDVCVGSLDTVKKKQYIVHPIS